MADDAELVRRCRTGSPEAMRELVERFQPEVFAVCLRTLSHRHDAEDVVQESFLRVFKSLHLWDAGRPLRPWVLGIAINRCRTCLGKRRRLPAPTEHLGEVPGRPDPAAPTELAAALSSALKGLRDEYREVFVLFHEHGHAYDEIAEIVDRPVGTVRTWLHRARAQLLAELTRAGFVPQNPTEARP